MAQAPKDSQQGPPRKTTTLKEFSGMNTQDLRYGVEDSEFPWLENIMRVGDGKLHSVPGPGPLLVNFGRSQSSITTQTGSLNFTGYAPGLGASSPVRVPQTGSLTITERQGTLALAMRTQAGALTLTGVAGSTRTGQIAQPAAATLTLTGMAPTPRIARFITPSAGTLTLAGNAPADMPWALLATSTPSGVPQVDFTGLAGYSEIQILLRAVTTTLSSNLQYRVSIDNGSNFLSASGDYVAIDANGVETNATSFGLTDATTTAARSAVSIISNWNLTANKTISREQRSSNRVGVIPTANALNALRVFTDAGNFNGGTIYVFGR